MRNLLSGLTILFIVGAIVGAWREWYTVTSSPADPGRLAFRLELNGRKVGGDCMDLLHYFQSKASADKTE
jgi:hypothetical protein